MLNIGNSCWEAYQAGDPSPALKSVAFYYFPTVGAFYGLSEKCERLDAASNDENFYRHLANLRGDCEFDKQGRMTRVTVPGAIAGLDIPASADAEARAKAFVDYFLGNDDLNSFGTGNPALRYWATLIPREGAEYGMSSALDDSDAARKYDITGYRKKMERLRDFFPNATVLQQLTRLLQDVRSKPLPEDAFKAERTRLIRDYEDNIERLVWRALFDLLEASADPSLDTLKAELEQLEYDLSVGDTSLGRDKGITSRVRDELKKSRRWMDGGYKFADKFVYTRYLENYRRVKAIQAQIIVLWTKTYDVDWAGITSAEPFKGLLGGGKGDAPRLTGNPEQDRAIAEACLAAQQKREKDMFGRLGAAVRRPIDPQNDRDLLCRLAALDFKREHLRDACERRLISQGTDAEKAMDKLLEKQILDLLNALRAENYRFLIVGKTSCKVGESLTLSAKIEGLSETNKKRLQIVWSDGLGAGMGVALKPLKPGKVTVRYSVYTLVNGNKTLYAEAAPFVVDVKGAPKMDDDPNLRVSLAIVVRSKAPLNEKIPLLARVGNLRPEQLARYRFKWTSVTDSVSLGRGQKALLAPKSVGKHTVRLEAFELDPKGAELKKGECTADIEITPAPEKPRPESTIVWTLPGAGGAAPTPDAAAKEEEPAGVITGPKEVREGEPFTVSVQLPPSAARASYIVCGTHWMQAEAASTRSTSFNFIIPPTNGTAPYTGTIRITAYADLHVEHPEAGNDYLGATELYNGTHEFKVIPMSFTTALPSGWNGNTDRTSEMVLWSNGSFQRPVKVWNVESQSEMDATSGYGYNAHLKLEANHIRAYHWLSTPNTFRSMEELAKAETPALAIEQAYEDFRKEAARMDLKVSGFKLGEYKGYIAESPVSSNKGSMPVFDSGGYVGGAHAGASWRALVFVTRGMHSLRVELAARAYGGRDGKEDQWVVSNAERLRSEALAALSGIRTRGYPMQSSGSSSDNQQEQATAGQPLLQLSAVITDISKPKLLTGETCTLRVNATGGQPPYKYAWTGAEGKKETATAMPRVPGSHSITVCVTDARGQSVTAYQSIEASAPPAHLQVPRKVGLGESVPMRAWVDFAGNEYQYLWFIGDAAPIEQVGGGSTVLDHPFMELGDVPVRVEVRVRQKGANYWDRYSDAEPQTVLVSSSQFRVDFTPSDAKPGDEVLAEVHAQAAALDELLHYRWQEPASGNRWIYSDPESKIGFKLKDGSPVRLRATALLNSNGREVGQVEAVYQTSQYSVKATLVGPANQGPRPMVWSNSAGGLIPIEKGSFGTDETALVAAEITPANDKVRWKWSANEDTTIQSSELSREIRAARSGPGTATLSVVATDPDGVQLGTASVSFSVVATPNVAKPAPLRCSLGLGVQNQRICVGESAFVQATVNGGKPPYRFVWTGDHQGEGPSTNFVAFRTGERKLKVQVFDVTGRSVETEFSFIVEPKPIKLDFEVENGLVDTDEPLLIKVLPGEVLKITVKPVGGRAPYKVTWDGACKGEGPTITCEGTGEVLVQVKDDAGARGQLKLKVEAMRSLLDLPRKR